MAASLKFAPKKKSRLENESQEEKRTPIKDSAKFAKPVPGTCFKATGYRPYFAPFDPALKAGLLIFSLCAGAPFLIKLTQTAKHDVALGAAVMMLLMVVTVVYTPIVLPLVLSANSVDAWAVAKSLLLQLLLPIAVGMVVVHFLSGIAKKVQPWVGWLGNIALYVLVGATLIGYEELI